MKRLALYTVLLLQWWVLPSFAFEFIGHGGIYIYYPEGQFELASKLMDASDRMVAFIQNKGLEVARPLHIVIDENLDSPGVEVDLIPHREIRLPLRAPGVLEDGANEPDPWQYFLFMGLCSQAIYGERSGIPGALHGMFGEISSPNLILPEWGVDGIAFMLYGQYQHNSLRSPMADSIFNAGPIPELDKASNHPDVWPGRLSHRIYGRPFIYWLDRRYGWDKILEVLRLHGRGLVPIEIDNEARSVFGQSWDRLWNAFKKEHDGIVHNGSSLPIVGYWHDPFIYWNEIGVHPGMQSKGIRGRYGYVDNEGWLRLSEVDRQGISEVKIQRNGTVYTVSPAHMWDPGPGNVAISRRGRQPVLVLNAAPLPPSASHEGPAKDSQRRLIDGPPGVIQLSGPVLDESGRVAVAGNSDGNWDIWLFDGAWHRITNAPSIEMDPWLENDRLIFSSNISGRFQIHAYDMQQLTDVPTAAVLPRHKTFLYLKTKGWQPSDLPVSAEDLPPLTSSLPMPNTGQPFSEPEPEYKANPYSPAKSICPNYIMPDLFIDTENFQFGASTRGEDVTRQYAWDGGVRYAPDSHLFSWRIGGQAHSWNARATSYPFGYTTSRRVTVDEVRTDIKLGWSPKKIQNLELSANWRYFIPQQTAEPAEDEWWGALSYRRAFGNLRTFTNIDLFNNNSQSAYGEISYRFGQRISSVVQLWGGKTWGDLETGHNTFRIGGNSAEGYFTQRPTRLFPLRGFATSFLDAGQAATLEIETFWPLARLQAGYKSLPVFLHNISIGTFLDSGFASERLDSDNILASAGFELITGMELAWGYMADFRLGWAWPLRKPEDVEQAGPVFLIQIGRPL